jgi:hypothetical protein
LTKKENWVVMANQTSSGADGDVVVLVVGLCDCVDKAVAVDKQYGRFGIAGAEEGRLDQRPDRGEAEVGRVLLVGTRVAQDVGRG